MRNKQTHPIVDTIFTRQTQLNQLAVEACAREECHTIHWLISEQRKMDHLRRMLEARGIV